MMKKNTVRDVRWYLSTFIKELIQAQNETKGETSASRHTSNSASDD
jgi:hypothetical protein